MPAATVSFVVSSIKIKLPVTARGATHGVLTGTGEERARKAHSWVAHILSASKHRCFDLRLAESR